jgi:radical SAM superfamily enzyme YgiQ (UPF0313 family)
LTAVPGRKDRDYLISKERFIEEFPAPRRGALPVFTGYPASYRIGMSNLGFHFLFGRLRRSPALRVERFFADTSPFTLESGSEISKASVIMFSVSYEEDYVNLVRILCQSGIEPLRSERGGRPVLIAGGPAVSANPFPLSEIVDVFSLGEGEGVIGIIASSLEDYRDEVPMGLLGRLADVPGIFVPGFSSDRVVFAPVGEEANLVKSVAVTPSAAFPDTLLIESGRGCPGTCSFCMSKALYGPFRALPLWRLTDCLSSLKVPVRSIGLVSSAVAAHPEFERMIGLIMETGIRVSFSSLRAEDIDEDTAQLIGSAGARSVSLAPESGSEALRFNLGKRVKNEAYLLAAGELYEAGVRNFNLYILTGCPGESTETVDETGSFLEDFKVAIGGRRFSVHVNIVVPKPWTPLEFYPMPEEEELNRRMEGIKAVCRSLGLVVRMKSVRSAVRQALLSLGDERIGRGIIRYVRGNISWKKALGAEGVDLRLPHRVRGPEYQFPWDVIEGPVKRETLFRRYRSLIVA